MSDPVATAPPAVKPKRVQGIYRPFQNAHGQPKGTLSKSAVTARKLANPETLDKFCEAIVRYGGTGAACERLGLDETAVWRQAKHNTQLNAVLWAARQMKAEKQWEECPRIADEATPETVGVARLRIETRMRSAGKLMQSVYGDAAAQTNVNVTNNAAYVVCDEATRAKLIAMREALQAPRQAQVIEERAT
jgi:hypothetical protein